MESTRQKKVARLILKELAQIINKESGNILGPIIVGITAVRISPDLAYANVFLSIFPVTDLLDALNNHGFGCRPIWKPLSELPHFSDCPSMNLLVTKDLASPTLAKWENILSFSMNFLPAWRPSLSSKVKTAPTPLGSSSVASLLSG